MQALLLCQPASYRHLDAGVLEVVGWYDLPVVGRAGLAPEDVGAEPRVLVGHGQASGFRVIVYVYSTWSLELTACPPVSERSMSAAPVVLLNSPCSSQDSVASAVIVPTET